MATIKVLPLFGIPTTVRQFVINYIFPFTKQLRDILLPFSRCQTNLIDCLQYDCSVSHVVKPLMY